MSEYFVPLCCFCRHYNAKISLRYKPPTCTAFSDSIPTEIWTGIFDHRTPHLNDGGIQFEKYVDKEMLVSFFAKEKDERIEWELKVTLEALWERRKAGVTFPPIAEGEEALLSQLKDSYRYTEEEYIPRDLLDWLIEQTEQSLAAKRNQNDNVSDH